MRMKVILLSVLYSCLFYNCTEESSYVIQEEELIDVDLSESFFTQENIDKLREAKKRFDEFVYKDEQGDYKVLLESGEEIGITEPTFEYLKGCLIYRRLLNEIRKQIQMERDTEHARSSPMLDPFEYYVLGQLVGMWNMVIGTIAIVEDMIIELVQKVALVCYVRVAILLELIVTYYTGLSSPQFPVPPFCDCPIPVYALNGNGQCFGPTNAPDGIYAYPNYRMSYASFPQFYIVVENGMVWGYGCVNYNYSIFRSSPRFYRDEHTYLAGPY